MKTYSVLVGGNTVSIKADEVAALKDAVGQPICYRFYVEGEIVASFQSHSLMGYWVAQEN